MEELKVFDIVKHFKYETLTEEQKKAGLYTYRIVSLDAVHTETGDIWSSTKLCMMAVLMGSMLSLIRYLPDQQRCSFQKWITKNTQISNRNTDLKSLIRSQGANPLAFLFPDTFYILRISDKF